MKKSLTAIAAGIWLIASTAGAGEHRVVFVTSVTGNVILGDWPDAGGATGLAAADNICRNRAAAGGLDNPGNFVAWISDSGDDAYCRVHGLTGKKADDCGQASLPADAGPWVRTDGYPFAPGIERLLMPDNVVYTPPMFDEFGTPVNPFQSMLTATWYDGTLIGESCGDWTDNTLSGLRTGQASAASGGWTHTSSNHCSFPFAALICMERLTGPALPPIESQGGIAFLSSASGNGDLGAWPEAGGESGLAAGDAICRALAADAGLAGASSFKAWLSDGTTDAIDRIEHDGPWRRLDGVPVAANKAELTADRWFTALVQTEQGDYLLEGVDGNNVWTATQTDGTATADNCQNWSDGTDTESGTRGLAYTASSWRTDFSTLGCHITARLYCLSDVSLTVFADRFEQP